MKSTQLCRGLGNQLTSIVFQCGRGPVPYRDLNCCSLLPLRFVHVLPRNFRFSTDTFFFRLCPPDGLVRLSCPNPGTPARIFLATEPPQFSVRKAADPKRPP